MKKIKTDKLTKKHYQYFYDEGIDVDVSGVGFIADLSAEVITLPNCMKTIFSQEDGQVETLEVVPMTVGEYFGTKKHVDGIDYVYAQIRHGKGFKYPTPSEWNLLFELFNGDVISEDEWDSLVEEGAE